MQNAYLVTFVHTCACNDFDRSRGQVNPTVYSIEKDGMDHADCIMCVSELTRQTVINQYHKIQERYLLCTMQFILYLKKYKQFHVQTIKAKDKIVRS